MDSPRDGGAGSFRFLDRDGATDFLCRPGLEAIRALARQEFIKQNA
jgi:hypothetical protein